MALLEFLKMGAVSTVDITLHACGSVKDLLSPPRYDPDPSRPWWKRPGLGIMYQTEYRPGADWGRDYREYNRSMAGPDGRLAFDGPFCKPEEWVELSARACADYHVMEIKWHDGICYFDTALTDWKTPEDYAARFVSASRAAGMPFMFYYSCIFDHNPQFDSIQPSPKKTMSFIGRNPRYLAYLEAQYREIMEKYEPDGMWLDWYWADTATEATIDFFRREYPGAVIAFNVSNYYPSARRRLDYTSGEAHSLDGSYLRLRKLGNDIVPVFTSAWKWAALARRLYAPNWELIAPVGKWWQDPTLREDPDELLRMTAVVLASGGRFMVGAASRMDGSIYEDQVRQLEILGRWYGPRKHLFTGSVPARYRRREPPGVAVRPAGFRAVVCENGGDLLLHLVNMEGSTGSVTVELRGRMWKDVRSASVEPQGARPEVRRDPSKLTIKIPAELSDRVDTLVRLER